MAPVRAEAAGPAGATPSSRQLPRARRAGSALDGVPEVAVGRQRRGLPVPASRLPARRGAQSGWSRLPGRGRGTAEGLGGSGEPARSGSAEDLMINSRRRWLSLVSGSSSWQAASPRGRQGGGGGGSPHLFTAEGGRGVLLWGRGVADGHSAPRSSLLTATRPRGGTGRGWQAAGPSWAPSVTVSILLFPSVILWVLEQNILILYKSITLIWQMCLCFAPFQQAD